MRSFPIFLAVLFPLVIPAAEKPNILLILADDVGSDAVGCYGGQSHPTPHIDALAVGGMRFTHGYSMPVCHPSRICLMTGRYPFRFGEAGSTWGDYPDEAEGISIGDRLREGGYATAVAGKWQLCLMKNDLRHPARTGFEEWLLFGWHEGGRYHDPLLYHNGKRRDDVRGRYGPDLYVEFLVDFMKRSKESDKPFFAYYSMALCHDVTDDLGGEHVSFYRDGRWMTYAEMISSMDDMVGRLTGALEDLGLRENTLVLFLTDNGTPSASYLGVGEDGKMFKAPVYSVRDGDVVRGGKGKLDDTGTRVPFIANWPGRIEAGAVVDDMVDFTDLLPTLAAVAGLPDDGVPRDGVNFAPVLFGRRDEVRPRSWVFLEHRGRRALRSRRWKLHDDGRFFDLERDPAEDRALEPDTLDGEAADRHAAMKSTLVGLRGPLPR